MSKIEAPLVHFDRLSGKQYESVHWLDRTILPLLFLIQATGPFFVCVTSNLLVYCSKQELVPSYTTFYRDTLHTYQNRLLHKIWPNQSIVDKQIREKTLSYTYAQRPLIFVVTKASIPSNLLIKMCLGHLTTIPVFFIYKKHVFIITVITDYFFLGVQITHKNNWSDIIHTNKL